MSDRAQEQRQHYAVWLTLSEAQHLNRCAHNTGTKPCCPHLSVFHNEGRNQQGGYWRSCNLCNCTRDEKISSRDCYNCGHNEKEAQKNRRDGLIFMAVVMASIGCTIGWAL